ncbi:MAG: transporter [Xanthobacteraceae bacterium]|nr:transporter [Xanthobacteraceae bacterium]
MFASALAVGLAMQAPTVARADEGGISFWLPGLFGSLAAAPLQPGLSVTSFWYNDNVHAGANVTRAREVTIGGIPLTASASLSGNVKAQAELAIFDPAYTFATPVLGGQLSVAMLALYGRLGTSLNATLAGTLGTPLGTLPFARSDMINDSVTGFGDLYPQAFLRWNAGVNNYMIYMTGDIPVGAYDSTRLSNIGIGHGAVDGGAGYTYFDPKTGHEISGVLGFTYNATNPSTQYKSGVDMHLDWGASQFLTKQLQVGVVGYVYDELGCDSGVGDRVGCFQSRVIGVGPQLGYIIPLGPMQAYVNLKGYGEFDAQNRAHGWNTWLTVQLAPVPASAEPPPSAARRIYTK